MKTNARTANELFAQIEYLKLRNEGARVSVAAAFCSSKWNVHGGCLAEAELLVASREARQIQENCGTTYKAEAVQ